MCRQKCELAQSGGFPITSSLIQPVLPCLFILCLSSCLFPALPLFDCLASILKRTLLFAPSVHFWRICSLIWTFIFLFALVRLPPAAVYLLNALIFSQACSLCRWLFMDKCVAYDAVESEVRVKGVESLKYSADLRKTAESVSSSVGSTAWEKPLTLLSQSTGEIR